MQAALFIFLIVVIKSPGRKNLRMVEFILSQNLGTYSTMVFKSCLWELLGIWSHYVQRQEENYNTCLHSAPTLLLMWSRIQAQGMLPHAEWFFSQDIHFPSDMTRGPSERWFQISSSWELKLAITKHFMSGHISDVVQNSWLLGIHKTSKVGLLQDPSSFTLSLSWDMANNSKDNFWERWYYMTSLTKLTIMAIKYHCRVAKIYLQMEGKSKPIYIRKCDVF